MIRDEHFNKTMRFCWNPDCKHLVPLKAYLCMKCGWTAEGSPVPAQEKPKKPRRKRPEGAWVGKEDAFQVAAIKLVRSIAKSKGMDERAVMHIPNGGQRNAIVAKKLKAQGTVAGYPDLMVFHRKKGGFPADDRYGLAIELKSWPNKTTPEQDTIHNLLRTAGWKVEVCFGMQEVEDTVNKYLK